MKSKGILIVAVAAGVGAPATLADPTALPSIDARFGAFGTPDWFQNYVAGFAGPSKVAPSGDSARVVKSEASSSLPLMFSVAGPSNVASGDTTRLMVDPASLGDSPDDPPPAFSTAAPRGSVQPDLVAGPKLTTADRSGTVTPGEGSFDVVVPLPGAGALAAAGLMFVAIRRRRR